MQLECRLCGFHSPGWVTMESRQVGTGIAQRLAQRVNVAAKDIPCNFLDIWVLLEADCRGLRVREQ